jgi:diketogulonate reductase-like aldo/keto reductase
MAGLPKTKAVKNFRIPSLGLGTWLLRGELCVRIVKTALELGYRHIDTARIYGNEREVGVGIRKSGVDREEVFITTKIWRTDLRRERVLAEAERSLRELRTDYIDLLLIHWPCSEVPLEETLGAFRNLVDRGIVRHIGVSNFSIPLLKRALETEPSIVCTQEECHPWRPRVRMEEFCRRHGLILIAYSPFAHDASVLRDPIIVEIARKYGRSPAQVVLNWLLKREAVVAIPKAGRVDHLKDNLAALEWEMDENDFKRIFSIKRRKSVFA